MTCISQAQEKFTRFGNLICPANLLIVVTINSSQPNRLLRLFYLLPAQNWKNANEDALSIFYL